MDTIENSSDKNGAELGQSVSLRVVVGSAILMALLVIVVLYAWGSTLGIKDILNDKATVESKPLINNEPETPRMDADVQALKTMSSSDEVSAIRADLESTNLNSIDTDMQSMSAEVNTFESQSSQPK